MSAISMTHLVATTTLLIIVTATMTTIHAPTDKEKMEATNFLRTYGFLEDTEVSLSFEKTSSLTHALSLFQNYYQLSGNGILTTETLHFMRMPRCGLKDVPDHTFTPTMSKWPKTHLTWNFLAATKELLQMAEAAFAFWSNNSSLTFARNAQQPDILISFRMGVHTYAMRESGDVCPRPFDGPGFTLAHAFYPSGAVDYVSEIHIDDAEPWYIFLNKNPPDTYHLLSTLTHEIGHSLGLKHSLRNDSIMFPYVIYNKEQYPIKLSLEDILAVQYLYGRKDETDEVTTLSSDITTAAAITPMTTTTTKRAASDDDPANADLCALRRLDAALILNHRLYIAHKRYVWSISLTEKRYGRPMLLPDYFRFLPTNFTHLSAVYQRPSGDLALFADSSVYMIRYPSFTLRVGWPKSFANIGLPSNAKINGVVNTHMGRTYVIYNHDKVAEIDECYMTAIKHNSLEEIFPGIPSGITSVFRHIDGSLYFFTKRQFYAFNEFTNIVSLAAPFNLHALGIECPTDGLLRQLRDILERVYRIGIIAADETADDNDDDM